MMIQWKLLPYNDTMETAASRVTEEIENYNRLGGLENHLSDTIMQIIMMDQIVARQNRAITALIKLQSHEITDEEILNIHEFMNGAA